MSTDVKVSTASRDVLEERRRYIPRGVGSALSAIADSASGALVTDLDGNEYIDFASGISVLNIGHGHPRVISAVREQLGKLVNSGTPVMLPLPYLDLAKRLCELTPGTFPKKAMLVNSGAEAVENAVKIVRQATRRPYIFAFENSFHGRTLLTMTLTGKTLPYKQHFGPYAPAVHHLPFPDPFRRPSGMSVEELVDSCIAAVEDAFKVEAPADQVAAIIVEPVQGEGGFIVPPDGFLPRLAELCRKRGIALIADEIQTGFGRAGAMFASERFGIQPDVITLAKSLAGGLPLAAVVGRAELMDAPDPGGLGGTFTGNPLACAAALAVLDVLEEEHLVEEGNRVGAVVMDRMSTWQRHFPQIGDIRGLGAMMAMEFVRDRDTKTPAPELVNDILRVTHQSGVILLKAGLYDNVIRFLMPLNIPEEELRRGLDVVEASLHEVLA